MSTWQKLTQAITQLTGKTAKEETQGGEKKADGDVINDPSKIVSLLMEATDDKTEVSLGFGSKILTYTTRFMPQAGKDAAGSAEPSSEYLRDQAYLLIGGIEPPEGDVKIRNAARVTLSFTKGNKFNEFQAKVFSESEELAFEAERPKEGEKIVRGTRLTFPPAIYRKPQRRGSIRVKPSEEARLTLRVTREAGVTFPAAVFDISMGGVCFLLPSEVAPVVEGSEVGLMFVWSADKELYLQGILVKMGGRESNVVGQVRFIINSYEETRKLGELVSYVERLGLKGKK